MRFRRAGWLRPLLFLSALGLSALPVADAAYASSGFSFSTNGPDGRMAMASRPPSAGNLETEAADDFVVPSEAHIGSGTFTGLIPTGVPLSAIQRVLVEIYRVFPKDSANPPSGNVPTRVNSPSDVAFASRDSVGSPADLTFTTKIVNARFSAANSVDTGIHPIPIQKTGGEGPVTGQEVQFNVTFKSAFDLPADHYFFVPQVTLAIGHFLWLSAPKPIVAPGTPFTPDLQAWIRNAHLEPDWLRVGTDIVGGTTPPTFNGTFSLQSSTK